MSLLFGTIQPGKKNHDKGARYHHEDSIGVKTHIPSWINTVREHAIRQSMAPRKWEKQAGKYIGKG
jgi:hypothetical protein